MSFVTDQTPLDFEFQTVLWTRAIIARIIFEKFGVSLHETTVGRILRRNKITPQKPIRKAYQQNPEAVKTFCEKTFPELAARAKAEGAMIIWLDESTVTSEPNVGRTWGPSGHTPVVPGNGSKEKINVIGSIDQDGNTCFMCYEGSTDSSVVITYIDFLAKRTKEKIYLILDNAKYHTSVATLEHVRRYHSGWLELVYLPTYSPELNPVELLWAHLKSHGLNRLVTKSKEQFRQAVDEHLATFMNTPSLGLSVFGKKELAFIQNCFNDQMEVA